MKMRYTQRADAGAKAAAAGSSDTFIVSAAALFVNLESHKNMMEEAGMEVVCGCCRWCREPVRRAEGRYAAADGAVVHEECMEEFLLEALGLRRLAAQAGYRYERGEDTDA
jgi:hypothetical protein